MNYHEINQCDIANGSGIRCTLYVSGCKCHCKKCQNPSTWDFNSGILFDENAKETLFNAISKPYIKGLTLSGGNPLDNYESVLELLKMFRNISPISAAIGIYSKARSSIDSPLFFYHNIFNKILQCFFNCLCILLNIKLAKTFCIFKYFVL